MRKLKALFTVLALCAVLTLTACSSCAPLPSGSQIDPARVQAGVMYLETTLVTVEAAIAATKAKYPDKAAQIDAQVGPVVSDLRVAISAFKAASVAQDMSRAASAWDVARPLVSAAISVAAPYMLGALVK